MEDAALYALNGTAYLLRGGCLVRVGTLQKRIGATILPVSRRQERRGKGQEWVAPNNSMEAFGAPEPVRRYYSPQSPQARELAAHFTDPEYRPAMRRVQGIARQAWGNVKNLMEDIRRESGVDFHFISSLKGRGETAGYPLEAFTESVAEKFRRKPKYRALDDMSDVTRGRIVVSSPEDLGRVLHAMENKLGWRTKNSPGVMTALDTPYDPRFQASGYPRYHLEIRDPATGVRHEIQVGHEATDRFLESTPFHHPIKGENGGNFHDYYDVFIGGALSKDKAPHIWRQHNIDAFHKKFQAALRNTVNPNSRFWQQRGGFEAYSRQLADEASQLLHRVYASHPEEFLAANPKLRLAKPKE